MDPGASRTIEVAALGRPFSLGMLYDCRQDVLVPGMTLWDHDDLEKDTREKPNPSSDFEMVASESIEDKSSALKVEASLKASFLGGLVKVDGSAKYLNDHKTSKNQARVTLKYKTTTKFHELSMNHLGRDKVKHAYVFDQGLATHVVTGILYGAQAFFVFDREVSESENHQDIQGNLKVMIKKIPCLAVEGEGSLKMEDKETENVEKFSCKFHGDFSLEKNPVSFQDAVQVYQSLPKLLGPNGENAVPVKVWLLPLTTLDSSAAKLVHQISIRLVEESQRVLEDFSELEMRCNDALRTTTAQQFPQISKKIKQFKQMCSEFKMEFQQTLAKKLPSIRGGGEEEAVLAEILKKTHSSPFNSRSLNEWMDCKEREVDTLMSFTNMKKNTKIIPSQNHLYKETSLGNAELYLSALSNYLEQTPKLDEPQGPHTHDVEKEQWYSSREVTDSIRRKAKLFSDFAEANKENKNIKFLIVGLTDEKHKGSSIYLYTDGFSANDNFEPPSKPETVTVGDIYHDSVTLKVSPPRFGAENITSYSVEYRVSGEDGWKQETAPKAEEVTVRDLSPNTEYVFRCRAVTSTGVGPASEVSGSVKTLPCSPPGKPQVEPNSSEISVSWEKPAQLGQDVHILSYIVEYAKTVNEEDLQWNQMVLRGEKAIISGLQSETEYVVRVRCDCGVAGRSKESISVNVSITKCTLKELKDKYKKATRERMTVQELIERKEEEIVHLQDMIVSLMDQSAHSITRLQEIALRPNPLTTQEYIDMLIEGERSEAKEGYHARIQSLEAMKEKANLISKVAKRDKLTKTEEEMSEEKQKRKEKTGRAKKVTNFFGFIRAQTGFPSRKVKLRQSLSLRGEMAQKGVQLNRETFSCSICLDLLKDPVTNSCGHSYCMNCIKTHWDGEDEKEIYSCPQCRKTFTPRPVLVKSTMLADLVEELKKSGLPAAPADHCYAGPDDVACDVCSRRKRKATKSCLICLVSYCDEHLQPHYQSSAFKKHKLMEPSKNLQENICSQHDEVMKMFCRTDQQSICYLCSVDQHKDHHTVSAAAERTERQKELEVSKLNIQQRIQDRQKDVKLLQQELEAINHSADKTVEDTEKMFTELIRLMEKRSSEVKQQVRSQQETEVRRVKELEEKLQQEITELKRKEAELKKLSHTEDHNQFLQNFPSVSALSESTDSPSINIRPLRYFEVLTAVVSEVRDKLQDVLREKWTNISLTVTDVDVFSPQPEPETRDEFLKYSCELTLDPNTAHTQLLLSEGNRKATCIRQQQSYPSHPDRFTTCCQVLSKESLTGRCYWEVEWSGEKLYIAVAYKDISRTGKSNECFFGWNDKSWALRFETKKCRFWHNDVETPVSGPPCSRLGVYLDHSAGILSFYSVSETMTLLHRVQTTFTQPLYAGVLLHLYSYGSTAEFCTLK
ncbi:uncharacterized protein LOC131980987 [Centropristis striata]|uniref:uncharacterized protein LOC131980987 n=1 Tax=Centropristis striata TaxID=184440 RepID=UPI0027DEAEED|nr:uncharacterized protein LOC131980987 [Centropristis striata]